MSQVGNVSAGGSSVAAGGAGGSHRGLRRIAGDFGHHPLAMAGLVVLVLALLDTLVAPLFVNAATRITAGPFQGPSGSHLLGTNELGQDELARLLYGAHLSMLLVGATFALAAVAAAVLLAAVRLLGRQQGQDAYARWVAIVLTPVVGLLLLAGASPVRGNQLANPPSGPATPDLFHWMFTVAWEDVLQHPFSIGTEIQQGNVASLLILIFLGGELVRFVYLLVQRLRSARSSQPRPDMTPTTPAWVSVAVSAVAIGLWVAADVILLEDLLDNYFGNPVLPIPSSLGNIFGESGSFISQQPWLVLVPLAAILILYVSLNLVGFGLHGALLRSSERGQ